jgi:GNAT superfamily N-acetyltransferase
MKDYEIRLARSADAEAIADVHIESRRVAMPWLPMLHSREDAIAYFATHVLLHEKVWVAHVNELVVGFIALDGNQGDHLYIAPAYQGRGIGDQLLGKVKECARMV